MAAVARTGSDRAPGPRTVIPGHGPRCSTAPRALASAQAARRLRQQPRQARAVCRQGAAQQEYKLLEWQRIRLPDLHAWTSATPYFGTMHQRHFATAARKNGWRLMDELVRSGAARRGDELVNL